LQPAAFEVQFGGRGAQAGYKQGLDVGPAAVSGKIDRIDADPMMTARAMVVDYKSGSVQGADAIRAEGRLQIPLYLLALREVLGREPAGGVYMSVRRGETRGILDAEQGDILPGGIAPSDRLAHEAFEEALEEARAEAAVRIERMRVGDVRHDPRDRRLCQEFCDYAGICRVAR
jgi:RecB family exonuclease